MELTNHLLTGMILQIALLICGILKIQRRRTA